MPPIEDPSPNATAPRVTPADIEAEISTEHYFTGAEGVIGAQLVGSEKRWAPEGNVGGIPDHVSLNLLTICVLVLRNGFTVTGENACASPENFDADIGRKVARQKAIEKVWPLLGFRLRDKIAGPYAGVEEFLVAAADGSMSSNNSEQLASELLDQIRGGKA